MTIPSWEREKSCDIDVLKGCTLHKVERTVIEDDDALLSYTTEGDVYIMQHDRECCEDVYIEDIVGDLDDLVGSPILMAEEVHQEKGCADGLEGWTFYKLATVRGYVTIRWYGTSNGYYSVGVDFFKRRDKGIRAGA